MRVDLRLKGSAADLLENLAMRCGVKPRNAILDSLSILDLAVNEIEANGGRLGIQTEVGEFMPIVCPTLAAVKKEVRESIDIELE